MAWRPELSLWVEGRPRPQPRARAARNGHFYTPKNGAEWREAIYTAAAAEWGGKPPLVGPLYTSIAFVMPGGEAGKPHAIRPDKDNLEKSVLDALTRAGVWKDDGQVSGGETLKAWGGKKTGGVKITVAVWCED